MWARLIRGLKVISKEERTMYINPFFAGIVATILAEVIIVIIYAIVTQTRGERK